MYNIYVCWDDPLVDDVLIVLNKINDESSIRDDLVVIIYN